MDEHGVAVAVEAVAGADSRRVGGANLVDPGEGGDQEEKGRLWKVEVGDECVYGQESMARPDHQARLPRTRGEAVAADRGFEGPHRGRTDGDDPISLFSCSRVGVGGLLGYVEWLGWNPVVVDVIRVDARECAGADVEHDLVDGNPLFSDAIEQGLREVEPGRGGGDAAGLSSVDRLVALPVERAVGAVDVGGKGQMAEFRQQIENAGVSFELHGSASVRMDGHHATSLVFIELNDGVHRKSPAGTDERAEVLRVGGLRKEIENLRLATSASATEQPGRHNPASIDDQEVSLKEKVGKVEEVAVTKGAGVSLKG